MLWYDENYSKDVVSDFTSIFLHKWLIADNQIPNGKQIAPTHFLNQRKVLFMMVSVNFSINHCPFVHLIRKLYIALYLFLIIATITIELVYLVFGHFIHPDSIHSSIQYVVPDFTTNVYLYSQRYPDNNSIRVKKLYFHKLVVDYSIIINIR